LLLEKAHTCRTVVRLKGGDPFVFGRGGEELEFLRAAGIPVEVVPGVSSTIGALAYAGVPITHRGLAANFAVVTGHRAADADDDTDWATLTKLDTLVILMGLKKLPQICAQLLAAGKSPDTPALALQWGTMPDQKIVRGTLDQLADAVSEAQLVGPTIIVVGAVAMLADTLNWFSARQEATQFVDCSGGTK
jgi:uroporphyrin-III C-methyltransferase